MPLYDQECTECGHVFEVLAGIEEDVLACEICDAPSKRLITCGGVFTANEDAGWLKSVVDVVDKDPHKPHCVEFRKNPTRTNYKRWMKGEGIRPLHPGERPTKPTPPDPRKVNREVWEKHRKRMRLEV